MPVGFRSLQSLMKTHGQYVWPYIFEDQKICTAIVRIRILLEAATKARTILSSSIKWWRSLWEIKDENWSPGKTNHWKHLECQQSSENGNVESRTRASKITRISSRPVDGPSCWNIQGKKYTFGFHCWHKSIFTYCVADLPIHFGLRYINCKASAVKKWSDLDHWVHCSCFWEFLKNPSRRKWV